MSPSIPIPIFTIRISGTRALSIKYSLYWSPSTWNVVLEREIIFGGIVWFRCDRDTSTIELSLGKDAVGHWSSRQELSICIQAFIFIDFLEYSLYRKLGIGYWLYFVYIYRFIAESYLIVESIIS